MNVHFEDVDSYLAAFPANIQEKLKAVRSTIRKASPHAVESIAYGMPAYKLDKRPIAYFAGYAKHIGFYATPPSHTKFSDRLAKYKQGKGSVQFPLDQPIPLDLIADMVKYNVEERTKGYRA